MYGSVRREFIGGGDAEQFVHRVKEAFDENRALAELAIAKAIKTDASQRQRWERLTNSNR